MRCPEWMDGWWQGWGVHIHWLWAIPFIFVVASAICVLFFLWRVGPRYMMHPWSSWHLPHLHGHETAQQILDRRYASGEITQAQHTEMKQYLQQQESKA
jgi:uncharacterized membrane protein